MRQIDPGAYNTVHQLSRSLVSQAAGAERPRRVDVETPVSPSTQSAMAYNARMPKLLVEGFDTVDVAAGTRLVLAIEQNAGVDVMHACGGNARCTTCRVEFIDGEPSKMTAAEKDCLAARGLAGVRLSCQLLCEEDMAVRAISRLEGTGRPDPGPTPEPSITPPPEWT